MSSATDLLKGVIPEFAPSTFLPRPDRGNAGKRVKVATNYFAITKLPESVIHHYDVSITPDVPPSVNRLVFKVFVEQYQTTKLANVAVVYDGRANAFAAKELPFRSDSFTVNLADRGGAPAAAGRPGPRRQPREFTVRLRWAAGVDVGRLKEFVHARAALDNVVLTAVQAMDIIFRNHPVNNFLSTARAVYMPDDKRPLTGGAEVWGGFFLSVRPTPATMVLNVDTSAKAFHREGNLVDYISELLGMRPANLQRGFPETVRRTLERGLKGLQVKLTHRGEFQPRYKIFKLSTMSARTAAFQDAEGNQLTVESYFRAHHNKQLQFPLLPCVVSSRDIMFPMEFCEVLPGQRFNKKLNEGQTAEMIKFTATRPDRRAQKIMNGMLLFKFRETQELVDFGIDINERMIEVEARELQPPTLVYRPTPGQATVARFGVWNMAGKKVHKGKDISSWGCVCFVPERLCPPAQVQGFMRELGITSHDTGVNVIAKQPPIYYGNPQADVEETLKRFYAGIGNTFQQRPQVIVCILPNTGVPLYAEIKRVSDTVIGVATQCVQVKHTRMPKKQYCANVCLKINVKIGGTNVILTPQDLPFFAELPTMVMGMDVAHPAPGDTTRPSIASVVGSVDKMGSSFTAAVRVQQARVETITDVGDMAKQVLRNFYQANRGVPPQRILIYRDGVSEGQFRITLNAELASIRKACQELDAKYAPTITWIVAQKRHHTRFFPLQGGADKSGNCLPGTVVETGIVHPTEYDFYILSHAGLQGTSRPTHYYVLHDENKLGADALQQMTYKMCYTFCRATRAVKVVPAVYYAHLVCDRARFHTKQENWAEGASADSEQTEKVYQAVSDALTSVMYFV